MNIRNNLQSWLENALIVFTGLLIIFLIGGDRLVVPPILQVLGRSHPLILHFPIVLMLVALVFVLVPNILPSPHQQRMARWSLLLATFFAGIAVLSGWMLSQEEGYEGDNLNLHKWMGVSVYFIALLVYFTLDKWPKMQKSLSLALVVVLIGAGHWGANLTHGTDFLMAPLQADREGKVSLEEAEVFTHLVKPILDNKCISCHQASKIKGGLRLDEVEFIVKGGKNGALFDSAHWEKSLLVHRIELPKEEKKHMPPKGKAQLSPEELEILKLWVQGGADFEGTLADQGQESPLYQLASLQMEKDAPYDFPAAKEEDVESLNNFYRLVEPIFPGSPALSVSYFGAGAFDAKSLSDLNKIKDQVVSLNLNKMPLDGVDLKAIGALKNLEDLKLNSTGVKANQLGFLPDLPHLKLLSLAGNELDKSVFDLLVKVKLLESLSLWDTGLTGKDSEGFTKIMPHVILEWGFQDEGIVYQLNAPQVKFENKIFKNSEEVVLKHPIGSVQIRYTLDGSEPDSLNSLVYEGPIHLEETVQLKARAFAKGWSKSETATESFYQAGLIKPDHVDLKTSPSGNYQGKGKETLVDQKKGDSNYASGDWLGFRDEPLDLFVDLGEQTASKLAVSLMYHEEAHIFPPVKVILEGRSNGSQPWKTIVSKDLDVPEKSQKSRMEQMIFDIPSKTYHSLRLRLFPNTKLPAWHRGAGDKGWVFVDEVVVN
ncbi:FN3 associated domain-containing protein [Echinicola sp. 20G]|uniref:FN3 associated domain-containing protein n=1 Tax=Echinicola sp. 20G TaxID=2781961 RepID=UPI001910710D|nr:FN3 associated domain-containing protein [Echinicola sp. 20G]